MHDRQKFIIQHWVACDKILFNENARNHFKENDQLKKYCTAKGAILSNLYEVYKSVGLDHMKSVSGLKGLVSNANTFANVALQEAKQSLRTSDAKRMMIKEMKDWSAGKYELHEVSSYITKKRIKSVALDHLFLNNKFIKENSELLTDWKGKLLMDAHKILREQLVEIAL